MRKLFSIIVCLFSFSFYQVFSAPTDKNIKKYIEFDMISYTFRGIERNKTLFSSQFGLKTHWTDSVIGCQWHENVFDFTVEGEVWCPFTNWYFDTARISVGMGGIYHYQRYTNISHEHDYIIDSTFRYCTESNFMISFKAGYAGKRTRVYALEKYFPDIYDRYFEAIFHLDKVWSNGFEIYWEHGLHDMYRYPLFCSPHYMLGAAVNLDGGLRIAADLSIRIVDGYTTAPYIDNSIFKISARYTF